MITCHQVKRLVTEFNQKGNKSMSALKAGMSRKTAAKYLNLKAPYHPPRVKQEGRTRKDIFSEIWSEIEIMPIS